MKFRQSVISVFQPIGSSGKFEKIPSLDIVFRQPFHNLGLAYSFSFSKSYFAPFTTVDLTIENINSQIVDAFSFDTQNLTNRPKVEIRAGYSSLKIIKKFELNQLRQVLPLIYSGTPYYSQDNKIVGGRIFNIQLSDFQSFTRVGRVVKSYKKGRNIISVIDDLLLSVGLERLRLGEEGIVGNTFALENDPEFSILKLENDIMYNHRHVLSDILPELARQYKFTFFINADGSIEFKPLLKTTSGISKIINFRNGLIEHPVKINFVQWKMKTLFGLPAIFYPGSRVKIEAEFFRRLTLPDPTIPPSSGKNVDNILEGLIVDANYNWDDSSADIQYTIAEDGQPINVNPIKAI